MSAEGDPATSRVAIGISFGNSYSSIAHTNIEGKAEVIANEEGDRQIPSVLSYVDGEEEFQGSQAKAQLIRNPKNTVAFFRDFLGQDFKSIDPTPCHLSAHPIQHNSTTAFSIRDKPSEEANVVTVSEITTRHLRRLASSASDFLGKQATSAVITVPTNFSKAQKDALQSAAKDAGLEILQFIHEPVASVLAYDARPGPEPDDKITVVADLGGTRSDVTVIACRGGIYTILATVHDYENTGSQLDSVLIDYFAKEFLKKNKTAEDPRKNARSLAKLKSESEVVKKALSLGNSASFSVESLSSGLDFTATVNRTRYELLATKIFSAITRLVLHAIQKASLDPLDVTEVILAGGTSHTPRVARNVESAFPEHVIIWAPSTRADAINPSELAARGAAIQANLISGFDVEDVQESCHPVVTATPHLSSALGVICISQNPATKGQEFFVPIIEAETPVPVRRVETFAAPASGNTLIRLCEGSSQVVTKLVEKEAKLQTNGNKPEDDEDDDDDDDEDDEPEEIREKKWTFDKPIAEAALRDVKKGAQIEVQINVGSDLSVTFIARQVGGKGGVRGVVQAERIAENGAA